MKILSKGSTVCARTLTHFPLFTAGEDGRADEARADGRLVPDLPAEQEPRLAHVQGVHHAAHGRAQEGRVG